mgnify:CR=1 FL=1
MFWPIVLPFTLTFCSLVAIVAAIAMFAPKLKWKRGKAFLLSSVLALVAFIPSCSGIKFVVDAFRFGDFEFETFGDVNDLRAERYLPMTATQITMHKPNHGNGYRARYFISKSDFMAYLDDLWDEYGDFSAVERGGFSDEGSLATQDDLNRIFGDLEWEPLGNAIVYYSPRKANGRGATYYFDSETGIAFQRTAYW